MITSLTIEHYRSIAYSHTRLGRIALFVGKNSSGKSNVIDALHFLQESFRNGLDFAISQRYGIKSVRQWSPTRPYRIRISVGVETRRGKGIFTLRLDSSRDNFAIFEEEGSWTLSDEAMPKGSVVARTVSYKRNNASEVEFSFFPDRNSVLKGLKFDLSEFDLAINMLSNLPVAESRGLRDLWTSIQNFEAYAIYPNTIRAPQKPSNEIQLTRHVENISTIIKKIQSNRRRTKNYDELNSLMQIVIPRLESVSVETVGGLLAPRFNILEDDQKKHQFNVSQISDGSLRLLGLLTALYQGDPPETIALEEPEQNINPGYLGIIADAVKEFAKRRQVLITTHSPHLVDYFDVEDIYAVELRRGETEIGSILSSQVEAVKSKLFTVGELMTTEGLLPSP